MGWCERSGLFYVFGLARNPRLQAMIEGEMEASRLACRDSGEARALYDVTTTPAVEAATGVVGLVDVGDR